MIGDRLARLAQRLVREDTYATIVAPAIADLQFEASAGVMARVRGSLAACRTIACAVADEILRDVETIVTGPAIVEACGAMAAIVAVLLGAHVSVFTWNWGFRPQDHPALFALLLPALLTSFWPVLMLPAGATISRRLRRGNVRLAILAGCVSALVMLAAIDLGVTQTNQRFREISFAASGGPNAIARGTREHTSWHLSKLKDRQSLAEMHFRLSNCASSLGWMLIGIGLHRARRRFLVATGVAAYGLMLPPTAVVTSGIRQYDFPSWAAWFPTSIVLAVGAWTAYRAATRPRSVDPTNGWPSSAKPAA
jgi:hypothetical protein